MNLSLLSPNVRSILKRSHLAFEVVACDPDDSDTAAFVEEYGHSIQDSANCILEKTKTGEEKFAACLVLATTRLDVNKRVCTNIRARKVSFASAEEARARTRMELGGVTPLGLPDELQLWVDARVVGREKIVIGGGNRNCKIIVTPAILKQLSNVEIVEDLVVPI